MNAWSELKANVKNLYRRLGRPKARAEEHSVRRASTSRGWRVLKWTGGIFASFVAISLIVLALIDWNAMRGPVAHYLSGRLQRQVRIAGDLDVKLFSWTPTAIVNDLIIEQPDWVKQEQPKAAETFADVSRLAISLDLMKYLTGRLILPEVTIDRPQLHLLRDEAGRANWRRKPDEEISAPRLPPIRHFVIRDGRLDLADAKRKLEFSGTVASEENDPQAGDRTFRLSGKGQLNRQPFFLEMKGDPLLNVDPDKPYGFDSDIRAGASRIVAKGSLDRPFDLGAFAVTATFSGSDLADLYYLTGLALPNTPPYRLSGDLTRARDDWKVGSLNGKVGDSDLRGELNVDASRERPYLTGKLASTHLNFDDLGPLIGAPPAPGKVQSASVKPTTAPKQVVAEGRALPDTPLDAERLKQMDADVHYRADAIVSRDIPLRSADVQVALKEGVLRLEAVDISFTKGKMVGNVQIDARKNVPESDIDVRVSELHLEDLVRGNPPPLEGTLLARAKLHGSGNSVHKAASTANGTLAVVVPRGQIRQSFAELLGINIARALLLNDRAQTDIRCAVANFSAQDGVLNLSQFVFDTEVVQVSGEGNVNLKDEQIHLKLTGHPKRPRLVRVRAPITIGGTLSHPELGVQAGDVIAQGGLAVGLAWLLSPLASVLPFVDPGLRQDADCGALLQQAQLQLPASRVTR